MYEATQHSLPIRNSAGSVRGRTRSNASVSPHRTRLEVRSRSHHPTARHAREVLAFVDEPIEVPSFVLPAHRQIAVARRSAAPETLDAGVGRPRTRSSAPAVLGVVEGTFEVGASGDSRSTTRSTASARTRPHVVVRWVLALAVCVAAVVGIAATGAAASAEPTPGVEHVVRPGESLWSIASDLDLDVDTRELVDQLMEANGTDVLRTGEVVTIPAELAARSTTHR